MNIWKISKDLLVKAKGFAKNSPKYMWKFIKVALFIVYIMVGIAAIGVIVRYEIASFQRIEDFPEVVNKGINEGNDYKIDKWMMYIPLDKTNDMAEVILDKSSYIGSSVFFRLAANYMQLGNKDEALFWFNWGRLRLRYDILRCGGHDSVEKIDKISKIAFDYKINQIYEDSPDALKKSLRRVIESEKNHPPLNNMENICPIVNSIEDADNIKQIEEKDWNELHSILVKSAEDFIKSKK